MKQLLWDAPFHNGGPHHTAPRAKQRGGFRPPLKESFIGNKMTASNPFKPKKAPREIKKDSGAGRSGAKVKRPYRPNVFSARPSFYGDTLSDIPLPMDCDLATPSNNIHAGSIFGSGAASTHPHFPGAFSAATFVPPAAKSSAFNVDTDMGATHPHFPGSFGQEPAPIPNEPISPPTGFIRSVIDTVRFVFLGAPAAPPQRSAPKTTSNEVENSTSTAWVDPLEPCEARRNPPPGGVFSMEETEEQKQKEKDHREKLRARRKQRFAHVDPRIPLPRARPPTLEEVYGRPDLRRKKAREEPVKPSTFVPPQPRNFAFRNGRCREAEEWLKDKYEFQARMEAAQDELRRVAQDAENIERRRREHDARVHERWEEGIESTRAIELENEERRDQDYIAYYIRLLAANDEAAQMRAQGVGDWITAPAQPPMSVQNQLRQYHADCLLMRNIHLHQGVVELMNIPSLFTIELVSEFIFHPDRELLQPGRSKKRVVLEDIRHFHMDKFARVLEKMKADERPIAETIAQIVVRIFTKLMDQV